MDISGDNNKSINMYVSLVSGIPLFRFNDHSFLPNMICFLIQKGVLNSGFS